jgi:membrane protease YdiL (CAAX protease family)
MIGDMLRKPLFWITFFLVSLAAAAFTFRYFPKAFPVVTLKLKMDRRGALEQARKLDSRYGWGPEGFRQAALFDEDSDVQDYVELEGGGKEAFARLIAGNIYSPYTWVVRHFKEQTTRETVLAFTPEGKPYGFHIKIPEQEPGNNIADDEARLIAERAAANDWGIDFKAFKLVEQSRQKRTGGRIDHTFIYELPEKLGEARYRLRLVVSGDKFTELEHFVQIPEAFQRRFEHMRSTNNVIATGASISFTLLYILGGCVIGLFLLLRKHWVLWRNAVFIGTGISFLQLVAGINEWPLSWMSYDTALSSSGYIFQTVSSMLTSFVKDAALISLSLMAAESLTRKAFPEHLQFWRLWSPGSGNTSSVAGRTVSGYLLVSIFTAYQVVLYLTMTKTFGWWSPSDTLFDPNILATYVPWFNSIAQAMHAGVWEESLFRAVPIAGAALIGQSLGKRNYFIIGALIVEAVIFGSAHANYANEPAFARPVELLIPAVGFGLIYIYFGLLPAIILHFTFDAAWMSIPLFVASVPGIWVDRAAVIVLALTPLWAVIFMRLCFGRKEKPDDVFYNRSWAPPEITARKTAEQVPVSQPATLPSVRVLVCLVVIGLGMWAAFGRFVSDAPKLEVTRSSAVSIAVRALADDGVVLPKPWQAVALVSADPGKSDRFVWKSVGRTVYGSLLGIGYLQPPTWVVRFVKFKGDIAERAEEYEVEVFDRGKIFNISHQLPEARPGAALEKDEARKRVFEALRKKYGLDPEKLQEISATDYQRPSRRDWSFEFVDPSVRSLREGQPRISVELSGGEVTDMSRYIFIPEKWERAERDRLNVLGTFQGISSLLSFVLYLAGIAGAIIAWSRKRFSKTLFFKFFILIFSLAAAGFINGWQSQLARFSTGQPFMNQVLSMTGQFLVQAIFTSFMVASIAGLTGRWRKNQYKISVSGALLYGFGWGILVAGALAVVSRLSGFSMPMWPDFSNLSASLPLAGDALSQLVGFIKSAAIMMLFLAAVHNFTGQWSRRKVLFSVLTVIMGFVFVPGGFQDTLGLWLVSGLVFGAAMLLGYIYVFRINLSVLPVAIASLFVLSRVRQALMSAYPSALAGAIISIPILIFLSLVWHTELQKQNTED